MAPAFTDDPHHADTGEQLAEDAWGGQEDSGAPGDRIRRAVDLRLDRMREGLPWAQHSHSHLMDLYGSVVDLDLGWRMVDSALEASRDGRLELEAGRRQALSELWDTLTAEIIHAPRRDEQAYAESGISGEVRAAVADLLSRMKGRVQYAGEPGRGVAAQYDRLVDLDLGWRSIEETLCHADEGRDTLEPRRRESLESCWRELTTELVAILGSESDSARREAAVPA